MLWVMDGTLVDTEPYWMATEREIAAAHGVDWTHEDAMFLVGSDLIDSGRYIKQRLNSEHSAEEIVELLNGGVIEKVRQHIPWRPGARELLASLHQSGIPCALVTMSYTEFAQAVVSHLPEEFFAAVITGDIVSVGKPHPEPYLTAAKALGVEPDKCVAIEDSNTGAKSAEAAGCRVLVIENHVPVERTPRRVFWPTLDGVTPSALAGLLD